MSFFHYTGSDMILGGAMLWLNISLNQKAATKKQGYLRSQKERYGKSGYKNTLS